MHYLTSDHSIGNVLRSSAFGLGAASLCGLTAATEGLAP
ncbi:hypothetical protein QFZ86_000232 [Pseudomonas plecoglossicida]